MMIEQNLNRPVNYGLKNSLRSEINQFTLSKKQVKSLSLFCAGFILYTLAFMASVTDTKLDPPVCQGLQFVGIVLIIAGASGLMRFKFDNKYLEVIFPMYMLASIYVVVRVDGFDYNSIKTLLFDMNFSLLAYFAPLVLLFPRNLMLYKKILNIPLFLGLFAILFTVYFFKILHNPDWLNRESLGYAEGLFYCLSFPIGFVLMTYIYHTKKIRKFAFAVIFIALYFLIYRARRGSMFMCLTTMAGAGMIYLIYTKRWALVITLSVFFVLVSTVFASNIKLPSTFDFLMSRKDEDTRSPVEKDMQADMKPMDWVLGKGISGTYYSESVIDDVNNITFRRKVIETGYLQIILKGGIVSISLLGLILIPGVYLALFKSSNILSKAAGIFNLLWMVYTYPTIVTGFSIYYTLVWICVGISYSSKIRNLSDETIKAYIHD